ncbi:MAG: thioredoxin domain-containing protein [Bryobacteraceae bacterium]|nr:thioredoxin domain-containing protein [Bryobacteraceae bacterium]MDW8377638.1 thioredoxin domain-containing protein [Bryobacterales bacterium]
MPTNRLVSEKSPYLLQHAHNPVDWYPWGEEAFRKARQEDKPIFLSIGYSTCHWCHVMERESFESEETAAVLNAHFVPVKVDREERPDIDRIYMTFVQATTGSGGWPMSVWLTPDLKPFYGGTYFPPDNRYGRPGFRTLLEYIAKAWSTDRQRIIESGDSILKQIAEIVGAKSPLAIVDSTVVDSCFFALRRSFDPHKGGFGHAPKFPRPVQFHFLFRYYARTGNEEALEMSLQTLREMHKGGMYDQLGGGFHRYSVDARWFVPHFEKMLYDQAQLVVSYLEAFQITGEEFYARVARETLDYVLRDMTDPSGGFYSAEDADSVIDPNHPEEKGEGAFYIWPAQELEEILGHPEFDWFAFRYGVRPEGNVSPAEDPHQEFTGRNILYQAASIQEVATKFQVPEENLRRAFEQSRQKLLARRSQRVRPHRDDKILTSWNALMISAFATAAKVLEDARYLEAAQRAANFLKNTMYDGNRGILLRRYREGEAAIAGFLDDYAFLLLALLDLYEADFDASHLTLARQLATKIVELFEDKRDGAFFSTPEEAADLVLRIKDDYDGAEPSGNSAAVLALLRLSAMTADPSLEEVAQRAFRAFAGRLKSQPVTLPLMLSAYMLTEKKAKQIILAGEKSSPTMSQMFAAIRRRFLPHAVVLLLDEASRPVLSQWIPTADAMRPLNGLPTAYVCENFTCQQPATDLEQFRKLLE